jgi:hypothetical protein
MLVSKGRTSGDRHVPTGGAHCPRGVTLAGELKPPDSVSARRAPPPGRPALRAASFPGAGSRPCARAVTAQEYDRCFVALELGAGVYGEVPWSREPHTLEELIGRPPWMAEAACAEHPELRFVSGRGEPTEPLEAVCRRCLVLDECLAYALATRASRASGGQRRRVSGTTIAESPKRALGGVSHRGRGHLLLKSEPDVRSCGERACGRPDPCPRNVRGTPRNSRS